MTYIWRRIVCTRTPNVIGVVLGQRRNTTRTLQEHSIFGDEQAAALRSDLDELRGAVAELSGRLHAQFTTIAAHAEIAREQADFARQEARADLDRTRDTLIGLIEQLRAENSQDATLHVAGTAPGPSSEVQRQRIEAVETQLEQVNESIDACFARQRQLADMVAAFIDTMLAEQRGEPVAGLHLT